MGIGGKAHATRYKRADRAGKKVILDELCATTGWLALPGSPGALLHRGPLRTVRATRRGTRLKQASKGVSGARTVSYTHLTLPTKRIV